MITKNAWEDLLCEIDCIKRCFRESTERVRNIYIKMLLLISITPAYICFDIVLAPFEIGFYFFDRYMRGD